MARKPANPNRLLAGLIAFNLICGAMWSPATAPQKLRVLGAPAGDEKRIAERLRKYEGVPSRQIQNAHLAQVIMPNSEIASVESSINLLGRGVIILKLQKPVATITGTKGALANDGTVFQLSRDGSTLPTLTVHPDMLGAAWIPAGQWPAERMAWLIQQVVSWQPDNAWKFDIDSRGVMSFRGNEKATVIVGTPVDLQKKWSRFSEEMAKQVTLLENVSEINVSAPTDIVTKR
ncbi:MAG: hypothetical protein JNJ45_12510 [Chthonomonas sp.]|nr:hypothetical protein [Chthonomonas sp.]